MVRDLLKIYTLGGLRIQKGDEIVSGLETRKVEALLVYLAATRRSHPREVLAELFWEERPQRQSLSNLRVALASLRRHLGDHLEVSRESVGLRPVARVWLDAAEMEEKLGSLGWGEKLESREAAE